VLPFKLIFFVLVDGWPLVAGSQVRSYGRIDLGRRAPDAAQRTRVRAPRGPSTGSAVRC